MIQNRVGAGTKESVACRTMPSSRANPLTASRACKRSGAGPAWSAFVMGLPRDRTAVEGRGALRPGESAGPCKPMLARCRIRLTEFSAGLADFQVAVFFRRRGLRPGEGVAAEFGRGQAGIGLEGAIERSDRLESGVQGY